MKALVIDGYNVLHKIPHLRPLLDKDLREARRALTELALDYQRKVGGIAEVKVVFDGKDIYHDQSLSPQPHQLFSKTGDGDRTIVRLVETLSQHYHVIVASDDNFVRNNARAYNASVIKVSEFLATIRKKTSKTKGDGVFEEKKISSEDAEDITAHLKKSLKSKGML